MKRILIYLIRAYQKFPILDNPISHSLLGPSSVCRYSPRCSDYAIDAMQKYGFLKGGWMALKRIARCNPYTKGGFDPVV